MRPGNGKRLVGAALFRIWLTGAALVLFAIPLHAQESDATDWTGPYIGVNSGIRSDNTKVYYSALGGLEAVIGRSAVIGGVQFGYNFQIASAGWQWVVGGEGDFDFRNRSLDLFASPAAPAPAIRCASPPPSQQCIIVSPTIQHNRSIRRGGDVSTRLRAGLAWGPALIYVTGGASFTRTHVTAADSLTVTEAPFADPTQIATVTADAASGADSGTLVGWTLGLGGELSVLPDISIAAEYRRTDYGRHIYRFDPVFSGNGAQSLGSPAPPPVSVADDRVILRLNYRFD